MIKPPIATTIASLLSVLVVTPISLVPVLAADRTESTVERELARRRDYLERGKSAIKSGERAMKDKDYEKAFAQFRLACDLIPNAPNTYKLYHEALKGFCDAGVALARQRIAEGRYADASNILQLIISDHYDPECREARITLKRLEEPDYFNKTLTPKFRANVEQVKAYFVDAKGFMDTGRYDLAYKRCEQVLGLDPYNIAARKMEEEINHKRELYAIEGYGHTRSQLMWQLEKGWDLPVRKFGETKTSIIDQGPTNGGLTQKLQRKLDSIIIPKLELREATIREAIEFLKSKSVALDTTETDPARRGVNIVLKLENSGGGDLGAPAGAPAAAPAPVIPGLEPLPGAPAAAAPGAAPAPGGGVSPTEARITVSLNNIPLGEALKYVTGLANLKFKVEQYAVSVVPIGTPTETLITKEWKVPPGFLSAPPTAGPDIDMSRPTAAGGRGGGAAPPADATKGGVSAITQRIEAKDYLTASGVTFPPGASAIFLPNSSKLIVKNTQENLDLIEAIVEAAIQNGPVQVEIESKFVEIQQTNTKELSFEWLLGQANVPGGHQVFFGGGTSGALTNTQLASSSGFIEPNGSPVGQNLVTGGNRSGGFAISQNAIDALLAGTTGGASMAPAVASLAGVFTDPQFQLVIRALNQKKGVDLLSAPRVTTKSGSRAVIEIIREFRYPTEFQPPQIPQTFGNTGAQTIAITPGVAPQSPSTFPVTPTTPTAFETRNTGVTLEVEPIVGPDGFTIDLNLVPQVVEFEGFINYGSPIQTTSTNALTGVQTVNVITPNVINQPIFSTRKVTTSVSVFDGQTVVLGGLIREDVQKTEDKIPGLGDVPLIGRLFRSQVEQHIKRNLVIFVSARLINPAGEAVHQDEQAEETVETLPIPEAPMPALELPLMPK
jgi:general secretion pathway protein D